MAPRLSFLYLLYPRRFFDSIGSCTSAKVHWATTRSLNFYTVQDRVLRRSQGQLAGWSEKRARQLLSLHHAGLPNYNTSFFPSFLLSWLSFFLSSFLSCRALYAPLFFPSARFCCNNMIALLNFAILIFFFFSLYYIAHCTCSNPMHNVSCYDIPRECRLC